MLAYNVWHSRKGNYEFNSNKSLGAQRGVGHERSLDPGMLQEFNGSLGVSQLVSSFDMECSFSCDNS